MAKFGENGVFMGRFPRMARNENSQLHSEKCAFFKIFNGL